MRRGSILSLRTSVHRARGKLFKDYPTSAHVTKACGVCLHSYRTRQGFFGGAMHALYTNYQACCTYMLLRSTCFEGRLALCSKECLLYMSQSELQDLVTHAARGYPRISL